MTPRLSSTNQAEQQAPHDPEQERRSPATQRTQARPFWTNRHLKLAVLAGIALVVYANTLGHDFVYDDFMWILNNPAIRDLPNAGQFFVTGLFGNVIYRPLTALSFSLDGAIAGLQPWFYHAENILLHGAVTLLVYLVLRPLGERKAWLAAAFFAVLPVHTEVVANVTSRSELLATTLGLAALLQLRRPGIAAGLLLLALLAKESAIAIPALTVLFWWRMSERPPLRRMALTLGMLAFATGAYLFLRFSTHGSIEVPQGVLYELDNPLVLADLPTRVRTALMIVGQNLGLCLVPYHFSADYSYNQIPLVTAWSEPRFLLWTALPVALLAGAAASHRKRPDFLLGLAWFFVALAPVSNLLMPIGTIRAERLLYLPSVGACLVVAEALELLLERRRQFAVALAAVLLLALGVVTVRRNIVWRNQETLAKATVADAPNSARAHHMLANYRKRAENCAAAVPGFRRSLEILPDLWQSSVGLADCMERTGDLFGAERRYQKLFMFIPGDRTLAQILTDLCALRNDWRCVAITMRHLISYNTEAAADPGAWVALGNAMLRLGDLNLAEAAYYRSISLGGTPVGRFNLAGLLVRKGRYRQAAEQYRAAEIMGMNSRELYEDWADTQKKAGDLRGARQTAARGLARFPDSEVLMRLAH